MSILVEAVYNLLALDQKLTTLFHSRVITLALLLSRLGETRLTDNKTSGQVKQAGFRRNKLTFLEAMFRHYNLFNYSCSRCGC